MITHMRKRAIFDFYLHHLTNARYNRGGAGMQDWVTPTASLTLGIIRTRCNIISTNVLDSVRSRDVPNVITVPVGGRDPT